MRPLGQQKAIAFSGSFDGLDVIISVRGPSQRLPEIEAFAASLAEHAEVIGFSKEASRVSAARAA